MNLKHLSSSIDKFPPKRLFGNTKEEFLETRKKDLEKYLVSVSKNPEISQSPYFKKFIKPQDRTLFKQGMDRANTQTSNKKTIEEAEEALKPVLTVLVEETSGQFLDLSAQPNPLADEDSKAKTKEYLQASGSLNMNWKQNIPKNEIPLSELIREKILNHKI